jgi:hypothetical protein
VYLLKLSPVIFAYAALSIRKHSDANSPSFLPKLSARVYNNNHKPETQHGGGGGPDWSIWKECFFPPGYAQAYKNDFQVVLV